MKKKSVILGRPKITDHVLRSLCGLSFCPKITVWVVANIPNTHSDAQYLIFANTIYQKWI